ncbi:MAG: histone deacetylase [Planctomycetaceae bacterium]
MKSSALSFIRRRWLSILMLVLVGGWIAFINLPGANLESTPYQPTGRTITSDDEASSTSWTPFRARVVYSPGYLISLGGLEKVHPFDIRKYEKIHKQLLQDGLLTDAQTFKPKPLTDEDLRLVHTQPYLDSLASRKMIAQYLEAPVIRWAPVSLDRAILAPFRCASGGTLLASRLAMESGIGINIGGGYHHAKPDRGEGFCIYADVAIAIRKLQQDGIATRAVVIDVDAHQGNGTAECLADDPNSFTFSIHQGDIYPVPKSESDLDIEVKSGTDDSQYLEVLNQNLGKVLDEAQADICFVVAGCDTLSTDPLASLQMTPDGIIQRDTMIVAECVRRRIPVVFTLSGGYSPEAWRTQYRVIKRLLEQYGTD